MSQEKTAIKYLTPSNLYQQISQFTSGMSVTKGAFELIIEKCKLEDLEWNHMDQMHRPSVHNTYEKGIRIALGEDFAVSLTQWKNWPLLITVTDVFVARGLFYQSLTIGGIIFLHSIISMEEIGNDSIKLKDEWFIASHKLFKFMHRFLNKKLYALNARLQDEDQPLRQGRFLLRKIGYCFKTDKPNYYNSNILGQHTIYPDLLEPTSISLDDITDTPTAKKVGEIEFIVQKTQENHILIWPAVCPHEGGPLLQGKFCQQRITCPWHGLHFNAANLSIQSPTDSRYGFHYSLVGNNIIIRQQQETDKNKITELSHEETFV